MGGKNPKFGEPGYDADMQDWGGMSRPGGDDEQMSGRQRSQERSHAITAPRIVRIHERGDALGWLMPNGYIYSTGLLKGSHLAAFKSLLMEAFSNSRQPRMRKTHMGYQFVQAKTGMPPEISEQQAKQWLVCMDEHSEGMHCQL